MLIRLMLSLQDLVRQWANTVTVYPFPESELKIGLRCRRWIEDIGFEPHELHSGSMTLPVYEGELCEMTENTSTRATDLLMDYVLDYLRWSGSETPALMTVLDVCRARWSNPHILPNHDSQSFEPSIEDLTKTLHKYGWHLSNSKPSLIVEGTDFSLSDDWWWFRGAEYPTYEHWFWDAQLGCDRSEQVTWWNGDDYGEHCLFCKCSAYEHGDIWRRIYHLRVIWPGTPLDGEGFRSSIPEEDREPTNWQFHTLPPPPLPSTLDSEFTNDEDISVSCSAASEVL